MQIAAAVVLGIALGALVAAVVLRRRFEAERAEAQRRAGEQHAASLEHAQVLQHARQDAVVAQVRQQEAAARAAVTEELASVQAQVAALEQALDAARLQHREAVEAHRREQLARERAQGDESKVLQRLAPVAEQLLAMQRKVDELEKARAAQHSELANEIRHTKASVEESTKAAEGLAAALKNNAVRGVWGETQLRTLVEASGMLHHVDFSTQHSIVADSGDRRPDMVVRLPGGLQMPVDAKVPYSSFVAAYEPGVTDVERQRLLTEHARKLKGHIDALAKKEYWTGLDAPELTVAYIPNDQLLAAALDADGDLLNHAFGKGVVLATPTNLLGLLKTIALAWRQESLTEEAQKVYAAGQELYRRIGKVAEHADKLRRSLERTVIDYNTFATSLESRVLPAARRLDAAGAAIPAPHQIEAHTRNFGSEELSSASDPAADPAPEIQAALAGVERPELDFTLFDEVDSTESEDDAEAM